MPPTRPPVPPRLRWPGPGAGRCGWFAVFPPLSRRCLPPAHPCHLGFASPALTRGVVAGALALHPPTIPVAPRLRGPGVGVGAAPERKSDWSGPRRSQRPQASTCRSSVSACTGAAARATVVLSPAGLSALSGRLLLLNFDGFRRLASGCPALGWDAVVAPSSPCRCCSGVPLFRPEAYPCGCFGASRLLTTCCCTASQVQFRAGCCCRVIFRPLSRRCVLADQGSWFFRPTDPDTGRCGQSVGSPATQHPLLLDFGGAHLCPATSVVVFSACPSVALGFVRSAPAWSSRLRLRRAGPKRSTASGWAVFCHWRGGSSPARAPIFLSAWCAARRVRSRAAHRWCSRSSVPARQVPGAPRC